MPVVHGPALSRGHLGEDWTITVRRGQAPVDGRTRTIWIAEHARANGAPELTLGLERIEGAQQAEPCFLVADRSGTVLRRGALADCAGCHRAAPGGVFTNPIASASASERTTAPR